MLSCGNAKMIPTIFIISVKDVPYLASQKSQLQKTGLQVLL